MKKMSRNMSNRSSKPGKGGNSLLTGVLIGSVVGVGMAAGVAWYLMKSPSPFLKKERIAVNPPIDAAKSAPPAQPATAASGVGSGKPRFEFYKVRTEKQEAPTVAPAMPADKPKAADGKPAAFYEPQVLQAGSFSNEA